MSDNQNFIKRPTMDEFLCGIEQSSLNNIDKSDIFWCITPEGLASLASNNVGLFLSPIENYLAGLIVNKIVEKAKKFECEECINYIAEDAKNLDKLEIALFDLLMREYVWHMGEVCYKLSNNLILGIKSIYAIFKLFRKKDDSALNKMSDKYDKAFVDVYKKINKFSYVILTNLLEPKKVLSQTEYKSLIKKYVVDSHVKFEELVAPKGHIYEGERFLDIIQKDRKETTEYYKRQYNNYTFLSRGFKGDYPKYFYNKLPDTIFGNDDIYKI